MGCHALLQGIFLTQGLNLCLLHQQADSLLLSHLGSPSNPLAPCKVAGGDSREPRTQMAVLLPSPCEHHHSVLRVMTSQGLVPTPRCLPSCPALWSDQSAPERRREPARAPTPGRPSCGPMPSIQLLSHDSTVTAVMPSTGGLPGLEPIWLCPLASPEGNALDVGEAEASLSWGGGWLTTSNSYSSAPGLNSAQVSEGDRRREGSKGAVSPRAANHPQTIVTSPLPALPPVPWCQPPVPAQPSQATDGALKTSPGSQPGCGCQLWRDSPFTLRSGGQGSPQSSPGPAGLAGLAELSPKKP